MGLQHLLHQASPPLSKVDATKVPTKVDAAKVDAVKVPTKVDAVKAETAKVDATKVPTKVDAAKVDAAKVDAAKEAKVPTKEDNKAKVEVEATAKAETAK